MPKYYFVDIIGKLNQYVFSGYISVNNDDVITNFYDFSLPVESEKEWKDVLLPKNSPTAYPGADNKFPFTSGGVNFRSKALKAFLGSEYNTFGIYNSTPGKIDYKLWVSNNYISNQKYKIIVSSVIIPPCFTKGTKILSLNEDRREEYVSVENVCKGDLIKTQLHGFRPIENIDKLFVINKPDAPRNSMYKILKQEDEDTKVFKDLTLMGEHSILVDKLTDEQEREETSCYGDIYDIDGKFCNHCCLSKNFEKITEKKIYECFHITLHDDGDYDKGFGVWANGLLVETPCQNEFVEERYLDIIIQHINYVKNNSPAASHVVWDEKEKRWNVDDLDPHEIKLLQEKATETMIKARAETDTAIKAKAEAEVLMAAMSQAEERIQKAKQEEEESLKVKEEAMIEVANAKAEVEELKRLLEKTKEEMEKEKENASQVIKTMEQADAGELLLQAKKDAYEAEQMMLEAKVEVEKLIEEKTNIVNTIEELKNSNDSLELKKVEKSKEYENEEEKLQKLKIEIEAAIQTKIESEEQVKNIQEQFDMLSSSKNDIENSVLQIKQDAEVAMAKVSDETKKVFTNKENLITEIQKLQQEKEKVQTEIDNMINEVGNINIKKQETQNKVNELLEQLETTKKQIEQENKRMLDQLSSDEEAERSASDKKEGEQKITTPKSNENEKTTE